MSPKTKRFSKPSSSDQSAGRIDPPAVTETVITLATSADRQRLRNELLRLIVRSESRRKRARQMRETQDVITTEGSANSPTGTAEA